MADKIKLLEIDVDLEKLLKRSSDARKQVEQLKDEVKFYQNAIKATNATIEQHNAVLLNMQKQGKQNTKEYQDRKKEVELLTKANEENSQKLELTTSAMRKQQAEYRVSQKTVDVYNKSLNEHLKIVKNTDGSIDQLQKAVEHNRKVYRGLTEEQRNNKAIGGELLKLIQEQDKEYKDLQKSIGNTQVDVANYKGQIAELLKENSNLSASFQQQITQVPIVGNVLSGVYGILLQYIAAQKASIAGTTGASKALQIFKVALTSTGIGAIIIVIGLLVVAFTKSQKAVDFFNQVLAALGAAFDVVLDVFVTVADGIVDAIKSPAQAWENFKNILDAGYKFIKVQVFDRLQATVTIMSNAIKEKILEMRIAWNEFTGDSEEADKLKKQLENVRKETDKAKQTIQNANKQAVVAFNKAKNAVTDFGNKIADAAREAYSLEAQLNKIKDMKINLEVKTAGARAEIEQLKLASEDTNKTISERAGAAKRANEIEQGLLKERTDLVRSEIANMIGEQDKYSKKVDEIISKGREGNLTYADLQRENENITRDTFAERTELVKQYYELEEESFGKQTELNNKVNSLNKEAADSKKASIDAQKQKLQELVDAEIKKSELILQKYLAENDKIGSTLDQRVTAYRTALDEEEKILSTKLRNQKITQEEYDLELLQKRQEYSQKIAEATAENLTKELDLYIAQNQSKIDSETKLTDEIVAEEESRQQTIYERRLAILEQQHTDELISEQDFLLQKLQLQAEHLASQKELEDEFKAQKDEQKQLEKELEIAEYETELETRRLRGESEFQLQYEQLERERLQAIEQAQKKGADVEKVETLFAERKKALDKSVQDAKLSAFASTFGQIKGLVGEETAVGKAAAIAETTINTYKAATAAYSAMSGIPIVGPVLGAIAAGVAIAAGIANVKKIASTKTTYADGGLIEGKSHAQGGVPFTVNGMPGFEAEGGEFMVNKRSTAAFRPLLEQINNKYGFKRSNSRGLFQNGGIITSQLVNSNQNTKIDVEAMTEKINTGFENAVKQLPRPVVAVEDINTGQKNYSDVVNGANI